MRHRVGLHQHRLGRRRADTGNAELPVDRVLAESRVLQRVEPRRTGADLPGLDAHEGNDHREHEQHQHGRDEQFGQGETPADGQTGHRVACWRSWRMGRHGVAQNEAIAVVFSTAGRTFEPVTVTETVS